MSKPFKIVGSAFILLVVTILLCVDTIPPRALTATRMLVTRRRIIQFARQHNRLPSTLAELPAIPGYDNETTDAWHRPLDYSFDDSGIVTLHSFGADKRPGGNGDNRDMIGVFASRDAQGNWEEELVEWKQSPLQSQ